MKKYNKHNPKLSEEILRYGKTMEEGIDKIRFPIFMSEIPYNGFEVILQNNQIPKRHELFFYKRSKYGWWMFCALKNKMDHWDMKLLRETNNHYGQYVEEDHAFCNDNMTMGDDKYMYNLHPNEMVNDIKQQIDLYLRDKEIEIARSKMTAEDRERIAVRANAFLKNVVNENKNVVKEINWQNADAPLKREILKIKKMGKSPYGGWLVAGKKNKYYIDETGRAYWYESSKGSHLQPICIMSKGGSKYIHLYDHIASRILALINDDATKRDIHTLRP